MCTVQQGERNAVHGRIGGQVIDYRYADARWSGLRRTIDAHEPAHRLQHGIVTRHASARPAVSKAADAAINETGKALGQNAFIAQTPFFHGARKKVFDQYVGFFEQGEKHLAFVWLIEVQRHGPLAAVDRAEVGGDAVLIEWRAKLSRFVAKGRLDFYDVSPMV